MPVIVPFQPSIGRYRFNTTINGRVYLFRVRWNDRNKSAGAPNGLWFFDVYEETSTPDAVPVANGVAIVRGAYLGRTSLHPLFTEGVMIARALHGDGSEAGFDDIGLRVQVMYFTFAEMVNEMLAQLTAAVSDPTTSGDSSQ